jgi:hypothetical protein
VEEQNELTEKAYTGKRDHRALCVNDKGAQNQALSHGGGIQWWRNVCSSASILITTKT